MKLFYAPASPFVRKVMILLHEAGASDRVDLVSATGTAFDPGTMPLDRNPLGKIPTLERPDGAALYDSRVITRYLDDLFHTGLYPAAPQLWDTLVIEATGDGIADAAVLMRVENVARPEENRSKDWVEAQRQKVFRSLTALEKRWMSHLFGPLDMGQIAVGASLGYLDFRHGDRNWRADHPDLAAWYEGFADRPSMRATAPNS